MSEGVIRAMPVASLARQKFLSYLTDSPRFCKHIFLTFELSIEPVPINQLVLRPILVLRPDRAPHAGGLARTAAHVKCLRHHRLHNEPPP